MLMTSTDVLPNLTVTDVRGVAMGDTIQSKHVGRDIGAAMTRRSVGDRVFGSLARALGSRCWWGPGPTRPCDLFRRTS